MGFAHFVPVNRMMEAPSAFDPAAVGLFGLDSQPAPWIDAGWVDNFARGRADQGGNLRIGPYAAVNRQFRANRERPWNWNSANGESSRWRWPAGHST